LEATVSSDEVVRRDDSGFFEVFPAVRLDVVAALFRGAPDFDSAGASGSSAWAASSIFSGLASAGWPSHMQLV